MLRETKKSYILTCPFYYHIFFYLDNWQNKVNMAKVSLILSQFTQNIGHIYMFDYTRGTEEQHKPWELKKLSTVNMAIFDWLERVQDNSLNKSKKITQIWEKMFSKILSIASTGG